MGVCTSRPLQATTIRSIGRLVLPLVLCWTGALAAQPPAAAPPLGRPDAAATSPDALLALNAAFREQYARLRQHTLESSGPILLLMGDSLTLVHQGERLQADISPPAFHHLKSVSHAALGVYVHLAALDAGQVSPDDLERLTAYRALVSAARDSLPQFDFGPAPPERQRRILDESISLLDEAIETLSCSAATLTGFTRRLGPLLLANADVAARLQIDAVHARVLAWKPRLTAHDWSTLRAVVVGSQLPRRGALGVQYFSRLLGVPGEGQRIIYAEALFDEEKALRLAGTHTLDRAIAIDFFNDPDRMHRDLLADGAARYLDQLFATSH